MKGGGSGAVGNGGGRLALDELELPLRLVAAGLAGVQRPRARRHRRRHVPPHESSLPHELPRLHDRAAQPAAAVPRRGGHRRARRCSCSSAASLLRGSLRRRGHELALALVLPAYLLHSLVDVDWDFVAVSALAFLVAGALVGRPPLRRVSLVPAARRGRCRAARVRRAAPALARRALVGRRRRWRVSPQHAITLAKRARSVDPLLVEPLLTLGFASDIAEQAARRPGLLRARRCARSRRTPRRCSARGCSSSRTVARGMPTRTSSRSPSSTRRRARRTGRSPTGGRSRLVNSGKPTC